MRPFSHMLATVASATLNGAVGHPVSVEIHVSNGLPGFTIVGLPDAAVREARDRVRAAILSSGLPWPLRRTDGQFGAVRHAQGRRRPGPAHRGGLLVATGELSPACLDGLAFCGELGLNGSLRHVPGMIALADAASPFSLVVPLCDVREATLVRGADVRGAATLGRAGDRPAGPGDLAVHPRGVAGAVHSRRTRSTGRTCGSSPLGRRAVEVAAARRHHLLMVGPPGVGADARLPSVWRAGPPLHPRRGPGGDAHPLGRRLCPARR